jgi:outer membrane protein TolC
MRNLEWRGVGLPAWVWWCCVLLVLVGCSRTHYRLRADREAHSILQSKTQRRPWTLPWNYSIMPDPESRFFDPTPTDDPRLPLPAPQLYAYRLPALPERRTSHSDHGHQPWQAPEASGASSESQLAGGSPMHPVRQAGFQIPREIEEVPRPARSSAELVPMTAEGAQITPVPEWIWESLPESCLLRMFEFESVREEYVRTFGHEPPSEQRDTSQRLDLEDIIHLASINARDYQRQKELLYLAALRLTLDRFDYDLKFSTGGNRHTVDYTHDRVRGETVNRLRLPTTVTADKVLNSGADLVARFANSVVLTFNGVDGFAADVGSTLLLDISQRVIQRDVIFERLTQSERDVVYAARDLARFRRELFQRLSGQYYRLLLNYRRIEIDTQDYFSNLRGWEQSEAEYRADRRARFEVDQFEQRSLESRSRLIGTSNSLERALDQLKLQMGLPTELPINLDLTELEELTLRDEAAAAEERVRRTLRNLRMERQEAEVEQISVLLNSAIDLTDKLIRMLEQRQRLTGEPVPFDEFRRLLDELAVEEAQVEVSFNREVLLQDVGPRAEPQRLAPPVDELPPPDEAAIGPQGRPMIAAPPLLVFRRSMELVDSLLRLVQRQLQLVQRLPDGRMYVPGIEDDIAEFRTRYNELRDRLAEVVERRELDQIPVLLQGAELLLNETQLMADRVSEILKAPPRAPEEVLGWTLQRVDDLSARSQYLLDTSTMGLAPIEIDVDDAMLTALTLRFNLMNQRERLADNWRSIKLASDDLKSILNVRATQEVRTRSDANRPFDFTFDDSQTRLTMTFDAPLNRRAQRNQYRASLINYNLAIRNLMNAEDEVKLQVRNTLRDLQVDREQYQISVSSAALAFERVVSTRTQLEQNYGRITARDVFEAQQDYTRSLTTLAGTHIGYLIDRIQLFMDLELLVVDDQGFWPELYRVDFQPEPNFHLPDYGSPVYGELPPGVWYSHKMKRMLHVPAGQTVIYRPDASLDEPEPLPAADGDIP